MLFLFHCRGGACPSPTFHCRTLNTGEEKPRPIFLFKQFSYNKKLEPARKCAEEYKKRISVQVICKARALCLKRAKDALCELGAVCIDAAIHTNEKEILLCEKASYEILDVGAFQVQAQQWDGSTETFDRYYVKLRLLGSAS